MCKLSTITLYLLFIINISTSSLISSIINGTDNLLHQVINQYIEEPQDTIFVNDEYDFIVVGAGTAGCVVAARLVENPDWNVLLIEAGGTENFYADIPTLAPYLWFTSMDWGYKTVSKPDDQNCASAENGQCNYGRGKVLGGSSTSNFLFYTRGNRNNYNEWARLGNEGWSYDDVLPYFKKAETFNIPENANMSYHGTDGPVYVGYASTLSTIGHAFIEASKQYGFNYTDYNGEQQIGVSRIQSNIKNGVRASSSRAYLYPIRNKNNFFVKKLSQVKKILINSEKAAYGVEYVNSGQTYQVKAKKEVILSAGSVNSPQILMLSGIGPKDHLNDLNIDVVQDLPVGQHAMDHILASPLVFVTNKNAGFSPNLDGLLEYANNNTGPFSTSVLMESLIFTNVYDINNTRATPNIEIIMASAPINKEFNIINALGMTRDVFDELYSEIKYNNSFAIFALFLQPKSRGSVRLRDNKYNTPPLIDPNYLDDDNDVDTLVKGVQVAMEIGQQDAFKQFGAKVWDKKLTKCQQYSFYSDEYIACAARQTGLPIYHLCGTCRMGPNNDTMAVVDQRLRVKGIKNLRVIDASIMPQIPSAHTNAPTFMVGEKGADLIKEDYER